MAAPLELVFTKRSGRRDQLTVRRDDGAFETVDCPKQGIIPHDMVHYAVESILTHAGFLSLVKAGRPAAFTTFGGDGEEAVERLVETFQAEMWGGGVPVADFISTYEHACKARGHDVVPVSADQVRAIRQRLDTLTRQWAETAVGGTLTLRL